MTCEDSSLLTVAPEPQTIPLVDATPIATWSAPEDRRLFFGIVNNHIEAKVLDDTGCDGMVIGKRFAERSQIPIHICPARLIEVADGRSQEINQEVQITIQIGRWREKCVFGVECC